MRRTITLLAAMLLTLGLMAGPALAHPHHLTNPSGHCAEIPQEPDVIHEGDPTGGAFLNNPNYNEGGWDDALHPIHNFLHVGPGAAGDHIEVHANPCPE